jgi:hypothetical protein
MVEAGGFCLFLPNIIEPHLCGNTSPQHNNRAACGETNRAQFLRIACLLACCCLRAFSRVLHQLAHLTRIQAACVECACAQASLWPAVAVRVAGNGTVNHQPLVQVPGAQVLPVVTPAPPLTHAAGLPARSPAPCEASSDHGGVVCTRHRRAVLRGWRAGAAPPRQQSV